MSSRLFGLLELAAESVCNFYVINFVSMSNTVDLFEFMLIQRAIDVLW
jgi:hypothetical protein